MVDSKFVSVLKKIGLVIVKGGEVATEIMGFPFISQLLGQASGKVFNVAQTVTSDLNTFAGIISFAETAGNTMGAAGTGSAKLAIAAPLVQQAVLLWAKSNLPGHNNVKDPAKLATACAGIASNFADAMNAFGD